MAARAQRRANDSQDDLIRAAQAGEPSAVNRLCALYRPELLGYFRARGLKNEAEDASQEVLLKLVGSLAWTYPTPTDVYAKVFALAREHERELEAQRHARPHTCRADLDAIPTGHEPEARFDTTWVNGLVGRCLERLRAEQELLYLALKETVLRSRTPASAAAQAGVPTATIRKRVWRAKTRIAGYLREELERCASKRTPSAELRYLSSLLRLGSRYSSWSRAPTRKLPKPKTTRAK